MDLIKIKRALISVFDKRGIIEFARYLKEWEVEIVSTGGTAKALREAGIEVRDISEVTGFPEILDGRVKTLHPRIHGGLLAREDKPEHGKQLQDHQIPFLDMVVVNLYPFVAIISRPGVSLEEAIENIDIGGPAMIRSAAKNYARVTVITRPEQYEEVLTELRNYCGATSLFLRQKLAVEAFRLTTEYDGAIRDFLSRQWEITQEFPVVFSLNFKKVQDLRYGENPHQKAAFYRELSIKEPCTVLTRQIQGKELSFNNILDADAAIKLAKEFDVPAAVVIKHNNPCGVAEAFSISEAYEKAFRADPVSAFGGVVALNRPVDEDTAQRMREIFLEVIIAPSFSQEAKNILSRKKDLRLLELEGLGEVRAQFAGKDLKRVVGGLLVQDYDREIIPPSLRVVTQKVPGEREREDLIFAWKVVKHVKSNAIVIARDRQTLGIGAGQMNRATAVKLAVDQAEDRCSGAVLASDGFFPMPDGPEIAGKAGIRAIIQPGGSVRDEEIIAVTNRLEMAMVFTGMRHFRH